MELCLMIEGQEGVSWREWVALARTCEEHGVPALFRSDHYMNLHGRRPARDSLDAWGTVCALAVVSSRLRLGTLVSPATFRHPSVLAKLAATADQISGGRVIVGLGAGWHEREHEAYGFEFAPVSTRMEILEEQLQVVLGAWGPGGFSFAGRHYRLSGLDARPKPVQQPHPPLILGGNAGPRSAALAARYADEYNTAFATIDELRERALSVARACEAAGREPIPFSVMTGFVVGRDRAELSERVRRLGSRVDLDVDAFLSEPLPAWIVGTVPEVVEQLRALKKAGVSRVMCQHLLHDDLDAVALIGAELAPRLR